MPKKILCISSDGFGSAIALNLQREGNEVRYFIKEPTARDIYKGILDSEKDWKDAAEWCDYAVFLNNGLSDIWEVISKSKPCCNGSTAGQELEKDRGKSKKLMASLGIKTPENKTFKDIPELAEYVKNSKKLQVVKPVGKDLDSDSVFLSEYEDGRDVISLLHRMKDLGQKFDYIECEEFIQGIETAVHIYFDGKKAAPGVLLNFETKRFASGRNGDGVGFLTGEMGTSIKYVDESNALYQRTVAKLIPHLQKIGYRGDFDCGFIVNEEGDYFTEHTPRKGIPLCVIQLELQITPEGELYWQIAEGDVKENKVSKEWAVGVVMVSPGFPDPKSSAKRSVGLPIFGAKGNKHCHLFEARATKLPDADYEISAGGYGYPLVVTGKGVSLESAVRNCYWQLHPANDKRVSVPKAWYRDDIGLRVLERKDEIIELGILTESEWEGDAA